MIGDSMIRMCNTYEAAQRLDGRMTTTPRHVLDEYPHTHTFLSFVLFFSERKKLDFSSRKMNRSLYRLIVSTQKWTSSILPRRNVAHFTFVKDQPDPSLGSIHSLNDDSSSSSSPFVFIQVQRKK